jgi:predicted amidophosphoribosyltransferase
VVAVPSTRRAIADRGFDAAGELARAVAALGGRRYLPTLRKVRDTADQAGLGREARRANLRDAFACAPIGGAVVLVDDILTTGATADACAQALLRAGADHVDIVTFARAGGWSKQA